MEEMSMSAARRRRRRRRAGLAAATVPVLATLLAPGASAAPNVISALAQGHAYRRGVVPLLTGGGRVGAASHAATAASGGNLTYGGGNSGVGVTTGSPRVYIVFWGSQWGTQSTNAQGYVTLSGDPKGMAPVLQAFFKGLGTGGELWSGEMTQYCEGVAAGALTCPSTAAHVGYPTGGALAGVWVDTSAAAPAQATSTQIGNEAIAAATHFGNTTQAANRNVQYDVVSPTGAHPDGFNNGGGFCAWHSNTGNSADGIVTYTNMPYVPDAGGSCGANFVNSGAAGTDDGATIVNGHEYAETITDQYPAGGWTDANGDEDADKCAWISSGQGASQDITLATGSFAVQSTWANDFNAGAGGCEVSHPIVGNAAGNTVTVTSPGNQTSTVGTAVSLQIHASDSASGQALTYSATGLPAGLSISSTSGLISGTPTTAAGAGTVTVKATDPTSASGSTSFTWTVNAKTANTITVTSPGNQTTTVGATVSLQVHASDSASGQTLTYTGTGLPAGLSISSTTGLISGKPTTAVSGTVTVKATDTTSASGTASFTWTVNPATGGCTAAQLLGNPGFETGAAAPWTATAGVISSTGSGQPAHSGSWDAWLDGYGSTHTDTLSQQVTVPAGCTQATFAFWLHIATSETTKTTAYDNLTVAVVNASGSHTVATFSNLNAASGYQQHSYSLAAYVGQSVTIKFTGSEDSSLATSFVVDDTALNVG